MEDGKEAGDVVQGAGGDGLSKGGSEMEELHAGVEVKQCADSVKSHLEIPEGSDNDEKDRENFRTNGDDGIKNIENISGAAEGNVSNNVEVRVVALDEGKEVQQLEVHEGKEEIQVSELPDADQGIQQSHILEGNKEIKQLREPQSDEVQQLEGPDAREEVEQFEASHTGEEVQKLAASDGKEVQLAEASDVNLVQESKEHDARGELQQLETPDVKERTDNQDAEIQIDDDAVGMTGQPSNENMKNEPADPSSDAKEKKDHTKCGESPVVAEYQAEAVVPEGTVNVVLGAGDTVSNAIVENDGDKLDVLSEVDFDTEVQPENGMSQMEWNLSSEKVDESKENNFETHEKEFRVEMENPKANEQKLNSSLHLEGDESGTEEEQVSFIREVETFFKSRGTDFKPPKFYGEPLNLLKLWRAVIRLGGYEQVTSCKLWRQIGESFNPPKTCTTVSWTFRLFYEKALLEFEKHKMHDGDLPYDNSLAEFDTETQSGGSQGPGSGRVRRDSAARAMQGWHSQRALSNGEIGDPIVKDKSLGSIQKREKHAKSNDLASLKRKTTSPIEHPSKLARSKSPRPQMEISVIDVGEPANWVKINVRKTKDCFEIYALVPGLLREEVRVQSDPAGRLVISGEPQQLDNSWGVTPFKKVVSLPSRIDPHQTSAVVTLHGQLFVRVPFEQSDG